MLFYKKIGILFYDIIIILKEVPTMTHTIESVVDGVIKQMLDHGISNKTVTNYHNSLFKPIILFCHLNGNGFYSSDLTSSYLAERTRQLEDGIITDHYYRSIKRMVRYTDMYAANSKIDFSKPGKKKYVLSEYNEKELQCILERNSSINICPSTIAIIKHFLCFMEESNTDWTRISRQLFFDFMEYVSETNKTNYRKVLKALQLITKHLEENYNINLQINFTLFRTKAAPVKLIPPYTKQEINKLFMSIDASDHRGKRDLAIFMLAFSTGLRACDIIHMKLTDIDWNTAQVSICQEKTNVPLQLPLDSDVMNAIADYILYARPKCNAEEIFLTSIRPYKAFSSTSAFVSIISKYHSMANIEVIKKRSFHSIRRSFASELSASEVPLTTISQLLGHTNTDSDKPYLSYNRNQLLFCAIDFAEIPIISGYYARKRGERQ